MRILSIITSFTTGGAEVLVSSLSKEFASIGHQPAILALCDAERIGNSAESESAMRASLEAAGVETGSLGLANRRNVVAGAMALRRAIAQFRPDVIHAHTAQAALFLAFLRLPAPLVMTHHNSKLSFPPSLFLLLNRAVDHYIAISEECAVNARRYTRHPVTKILNAADKTFKTEQPRERLAEEPTIISVGTISEQKDYPTLIRAFALLQEQLAGSGRSARLSIVGGGKDLPALQALAEQLSVADRVALLGTRGDVPQLLSGADIYVNSSRWEGLPVAVIEALMTALPVVATNCAGNRELVRDQVNGRLTPIGDPGALADALAEIVLDEDLYRQMSTCSLRSAKKVSVEEAAAAHLKVYRQVQIDGRSAERVALA